MVRRRGQWPYGQPTIACADCKGTGLNSERASLVQHERNAGNGAYGIACRSCNGKGRHLRPPNYSKLTCGHGLYIEDCALCCPRDEFGNRHDSEGVN